MSTHFWDEDPQGLWTLGLQNKGYYFNTGERRAQAGDSKPASVTQLKRGSQWSPCIVGVQLPSHNGCWGAGAPS